MQFYRVNVEITNICGLACSFCPPKTEAPKKMSTELFAKIAKELQSYTDLVALHLMGDPLTLSNLHDYLDICHENRLQVELTTSGFYISNVSSDTLFHPAVRQLNISLNSFHKNPPKTTFEEYMRPILLACETKLQHHPKPFINLRLWNMDEMQSDSEYNARILALLEERFGVKIEPKGGGVRIASKILLHYDSYFEWPSLESSHSSHAACLGLKSHFGILADGRVVPCCLDSNGVIDLGDLSKERLEDVLQSKRVKAIQEGFAQGRAIEELCRKCSYKDRFIKG